MPRVYVTAILDAPVDRAWAVLRDFNALPRYHPFFASSEIEDGLPADRVGCVRNFRTHGGELIRERLLTLSDHERRCAYTIIEVEGLPVRDYLSQVTLWPVTETGQAFGEWWAEFDADPAHMTDCVTCVTDTFRLGFQGVARIANGQ